MPKKSDERNNTIEESKLGSEDFEYYAILIMFRKAYLASKSSPTTSSPFRQGTAILISEELIEKVKTIPKDTLEKAGLMLQPLAPDMLTKNKGPNGFSVISYKLERSIALFIGKYGEDPRLTAALTKLNPIINEDPSKKSADNITTPHKVVLFNKSNNMSQHPFRQSTGTKADFSKVDKTIGKPTNSYNQAATNSFSPYQTGHVQFPVPKLESLRDQFLLWLNENNIDLNDSAFSDYYDRFVDAHKKEIEQDVENSYVKIQYK